MHNVICTHTCEGKVQHCAWFTRVQLWTVKVYLNNVILSYSITNSLCTVEKKRNKQNVKNKWTASRKTDIKSRSKKRDIHTCVSSVHHVVSATPGQAVTAPAGVTWFVTLDRVFVGVHQLANLYASLTVYTMCVHHSWYVSDVGQCSHFSTILSYIQGVHEE